MLKLFLCILFCMSVCGDNSYASSDDQDFLQIDADSFSQSGMPWFKAEKCLNQPTGNIYLTFYGDKSSAVYLIPVVAYEHSFPYIPRLDKDKKNGRYIASIPRMYGCEKTPFQVTRLILKNIPDIAGERFVLSLKENRHDSSLLKLRDSGTCPEVEDGLLKCSGSQTIHGTKTEVEYYMSKTILQNSGGPLRARCVYISEQRLCTVEDSITENTSYEVIMNEPPVLQNILKVRQSAITYLQKIKVSTK